MKGARPAAHRAGVAAALNTIHLYVDEVASRGYVHVLAPTNHQGCRSVSGKHAARSLRQLLTESCAFAVQKTERDPLWTTDPSCRPVMVGAMQRGQARSLTLEELKVWVESLPESPLPPEQPPSSQ
jgi:hypothetical protein